MVGGSCRQKNTGARMRDPVADSTPLVRRRSETSSHACLVSKGRFFCLMREIGPNAAEFAGDEGIGAINSVLSWGSLAIYRPTISAISIVKPPVPGVTGADWPCR